MKKSDREIMEILEAFDATGCANSAAPLAGVDPKTVRRYVAKREAGEPVDAPVRAAQADRPVPGQDRGAGRDLRGRGPCRRGA